MPLGENAVVHICSGTPPTATVENLRNIAARRATPSLRAVRAAGTTLHPTDARITFRSHASPLHKLAQTRKSAQRKCRELSPPAFQVQPEPASGPCRRAAGHVISRSWGSAARSERLNLVGLHALLALHGDEAHLLAFLQRLEAVALE